MEIICCLHFIVVLFAFACEIVFLQKKNYHSTTFIMIVQLDFNVLILLRLMEIKLRDILAIIMTL